MPPAADEPFARIDVAQAKILIAAGVHVIDVREPKEIGEDGKIPGSHLVPLNTFLASAGEHVTGDAILFYCKAGVRSAIACEMAAAIGVPTLYNLEGGIVDWKRAGEHVEYQ